MLIRNNVWIVKQSRRYWPYLTAWYLQPLCKQPLWSDFKGSAHIRRGCSISHSIGYSWDWGAEHNRAELALPNSLIQAWEWKGRPSKSPWEYFTPKKRKKKIQHVPFDTVPQATLSWGFLQSWKIKKIKKKNHQNKPKQQKLNSRGKKLNRVMMLCSMFLWWGWGIQDGTNVPRSHWRHSLVLGSAKPGLSQS